jgi:hypothetical protein
VHTCSSQGPHDCENVPLGGPADVTDAAQACVEDLGSSIVIPPAHLYAPVVESDAEGGREGGAVGGDLI